MSIEIHNNLDPVTELYTPDDILVGEIKNETALNDVLVQIKNEGIGGYYIKSTDPLFHDEKIVISKTGKIHNPPSWFYHNIEHLLSELVGF